MSVVTTLSEPCWGLAEAARVCGVSKPTVRRRKEALVRAGAVADESGWQIPAAALVAVGLLDQDQPVPVPATRSLSPVSVLPVRPIEPVADSLTAAAMEERLGELESELAQVRQELAASQARAQERDRCLRVLETALAALGDREMTPVPTPVPAERRTASPGPWRSPTTWTHPTGR